MKVAKSANEQLSEWHAARSRVLLVEAADDTMTGETTTNHPTPLYSLSKAQYIGGEVPED